MRLIGGFLRFWYHFIVGDDYRIALGVIIGFAGVALLVHTAHVQPWWLLPLAVVVMLGVSVWIDPKRRNRH